ncbi:MAG: aspartyl/asparaginyl beta-hydroxylase domain-containing protein [Allorhizobium sp.]
MRNFLKIAEDINTTPLLNQLIRNEDLWNQNRFRTSAEGTPFSGCDDILLRFSPPEQSHVQGGFVGNEECVWYPARDVLTEAWPLIRGLLANVGGYEVGRVIVSRLKPGAKVDPHIDNQGIYNNHGDRARYHIVLQGGAGSNFYNADTEGEGDDMKLVEGGVEVVNMRDGEVWWFNAAKLHWVKNESADDRIHLLVDVRLYK